jgi:hypothetical protein
MSSYRREPLQAAAPLPAKLIPYQRCEFWRQMSPGQSPKIPSLEAKFLTNAGTKNCFERHL